MLYLDCLLFIDLSSSVRRCRRQDGIDKSFDFAQVWCHDMGGSAFNNIPLVCVGLLLGGGVYVRAYRSSSHPLQFP